MASSSLHCRAGIRMPPSYITWVELLYCSLFPNVSFFGHLSGILAGYTYVALYV